MIQQWFGYTAPRVPGSAYIPAVFGTVVFFYGGWVVPPGGVRASCATGCPGMMTLISLAITVAFLYSVAVTLGVVAGMDLWWELATLVAIMLLGHWIEMRSISQAQGALKELAKLLPDTALRVDERRHVERSAGRAAEARATCVLVRPGASIPADGVVERRAERRQRVDDHRRVAARRQGAGRQGDRRHGQRARLAARRGDGHRRQTALAGIMRLVEQAQSSRSRAQALADRAAFFLTIVAIVAGAADADRLAHARRGRATSRSSAW